MGIREHDDFGAGASRYDFASAEETIRELEAQYASGEIERHAYLLKKSSLVRLYLKSSTAPKRRHPRWDEGFLLDE